MASKAYGSGNHYLLGLYFKRGQLVLLLILTVFLIISIFIKEIFFLMGQNITICENLQEYVLLIFPGICCFVLFSLRAIYLNSQYLFSIPIIIQLFTTIAHIGWCVYFHELGVKGIAIAMAKKSIFNK